MLATLAHDDGRPGVLAHRQDAAGRDVGVLEQVEGDEPIVGARLGVGQDVRQLLQMPGSEQVLDRCDGLEGQDSQGFGFHLQELAPGGLDHADPLACHEAVRGVVRTQGKQR